jgi:hypothetical protein
VWSTNICFSNAVLLSEMVEIGIHLYRGYSAFIRARFRLLKVVFIQEV